MRKASLARTQGGHSAGRTGPTEDTARRSFAASIRVEKLSYWHGDRTALIDVSFSVDDANTVVIVGPNGAGKSTLLGVLATLLRPHSGKVHILGSELNGGPSSIRDKVGLVGHQPLLYRELTARENLAFFAKLYAVGNERLEYLLNQAGLSHRGDEPLRTLSAGMLRRVDVCRAVLHNPQLLLLDEPSANLDPAASELLAPLIGSETTAMRVLTSHDPAQALAQADLIVGLRGGYCELVARSHELSLSDIEALYR
jgi:heme exporter protein A